jgi:hypothetical protein
MSASFLGSFVVRFPVQRCSGKNRVSVAVPVHTFC